MTVRLSTALAANLMSGVTLPTMLNGGQLRVYAGELPYDPTAPTGVLLGYIVASDSSALSYTIVGNQVILDPDKSYAVQPVATGVPGYVLMTAASGYAGAAIATNEQAFPNITSLTAAILVTTFVISLSGQD